ncbi:hypothetical protein PHMEG_00021106 [Phytophthora megakarya]|uniref:Uncharacterized protein n=1 Tax=Phytophthora megakarya TaxID=4795 RepID=A0A225VNC2_9STRA|nr:hypothetical protein PHMEG_00021106 [Phytophthora megakarya]
MDLAQAIFEGLRQISQLRDAIRRQRFENRKTYVRMMDIYVELQLSEPVQANPTLRRTKAIEMFANAVTAFANYLRKYDDMHRVVRIFKYISMEEKRLKIVDEIDQIYRMLNLAAAVTMMNGQASLSAEAAHLFAKLEKMHGDIRLTHDEVHTALLAKKQQLDMIKEKVPGLEPMTEQSTFNVVKRGIVRQTPWKEKHVQPVVEEKPVDDISSRAVDESFMIEMKQNPVNPTATLEEKTSVTHITALNSDSIIVEREENAPATELEQSVVDTKALMVETKETTGPHVMEKDDLVDQQPTQVNQIRDNVVAEENPLVSEWEQRGADAKTSQFKTFDTEKEDSEGQQPTLPQDAVMEVVKEKQNELIGQDSPPHQNSATIAGDLIVPLLLEQLGSDEASAYERENTLLCLIGKCTTNSNRVQVYQAEGIRVLSNLASNDEDYFTQLYALHCLSWFTFSYSMMRESEFAELQTCVREPTHSEMLSLLHELQNGDEKTKEVAALRCSCLATRGDGDTLRHVGMFPLLIKLLTDGTSNQKLWSTEALGTGASDSDENCVAITRDGAIPPLIDLLRSGTDILKQEAAYALGNLAANNDLNRAKIAREGAIPPMVAFVKAATDALNQWAVYALGFLSLGNEENRILIAQEGAVPPLVALLTTGTQAQKQWSAYTLGNLAHNDANRMEITSESAITPLIELLRSGTAMQKQRAAFALGNLVYDNDTVADFDEAILPLVELVRMGCDTQKEDAAYTLGNLAANNDDRRARIGRKGAIPPLVKLLKNGNPDQKQWAAFALRCLAHNNESNRDAIVDEGAVAPLAALMDEGTDAQKEEAAHALKHLVSETDVNVTTFVPDRFTPLMEYVRIGVASQWLRL